MRKPVEAIERMRMFWSTGRFWDDCAKDVLAYLDSIPDDADWHGKWPEGMGKERLLDIARHQSWNNCTDAIFTLANIAPEKPKVRMVEIWKCDATNEVRVREIATETTWRNAGWRKVGGPFQIEE